jgi:hypothetical protein
MTELARTRQINDLIEESVYGPKGESTPACANAWEVAKLIARLQARVEALEAAANYPAKPDSSPAPAGSLVERLRDAVYKQSGRDPTSGEMCAAIREVAAWLEEQESDLYQLGDALNILEQESNRG